MFEQFGMNSEQKQAIRSMYSDLADYVDEYITYGAVDFENLGSILPALKNVRDENHEPTQQDLVTLWRVIQKAQRTQRGPKLPKEDRIVIFTLWKSLESLHQRMALALEVKKEEAAKLASEKEAEQSKKAEQSKEAHGGETNNNQSEQQEFPNLDNQVDYGAEDHCSTHSEESELSSKEEAKRSEEGELSEDFEHSVTDSNDSKPCRCQRKINKLKNDPERVAEMFKHILGKVVKATEDLNLEKLTAKDEEHDSDQAEYDEHNSDQAEYDEHGVTSDDSDLSVKTEESHEEEPLHPYFTDPISNWGNEPDKVENE